MCSLYHCWDFFLEYFQIIRLSHFTFFRSFISSSKKRLELIKTDTRIEIKTHDNNTKEKKYLKSNLHFVIGDVVVCFPFFLRVYKLGTSPKKTQICYDEKEKKYLQKFLVVVHERPMTPFSYHKWKSSRPKSSKLFLKL